MSKWYVQSGNLDKVVDAPTAKDAMVKALKMSFDNGDDLSLGLIFSANEHGSKEEMKGEDIFAASEMIVRDAGLVDYFSFPPMPTQEELDEMEEE